MDFLQPYFTNEINSIKSFESLFFDNGIRNSILSNFTALNKRSDVGALFENFIYLHLQEKYGKDHVFYLRTVSGNEMDFCL